MKITLSWIKDYLDTTASLEEIVERLNMLGLVVDSVTDRSKELEPFIIAQVTKAHRHPDADRLTVCEVDIGSTRLQVVCGGVNVREGMKVVLAPVGSVIPTNQLTMKQASIRGVESHGMLCSATELAVDEFCPEHGIIELPADAPVGQSYSHYAGLNDPVLDIEITPNRGDCLGALGVARDLAASGIGVLKPLQFKSVEGIYPSPTHVVIDEEARQACPFFASRVIKNVRNGPSPRWMQQRLRSVGLRPISALVDITNYLSYAIGRPMHVFDLDKLEGDILIRFVKDGEKLLALDEKEYRLDRSMIVVADQKKAISIAGIMGGEETGCTESTTNVLIESAVFDATRISLTGRKLNILSDSRYRFERGVDAAIVVPAIELATEFILQNCGGEVSDLESDGQAPIVKSPIQFRPERVNELTGLTIDSTLMMEILTKLGGQIRVENSYWNVTPPSWRHDQALEADLVEEISRIYGYDKIPTFKLPDPTGEENFELIPGSRIRMSWSWAIRRALAARGLSESLTWAFLGEDRARLFEGGDSSLKVTNPISSDLTDMRPSLLPNLIDAVQKNYDRGQENICLFEVGKRFSNITPQGEHLTVGGVRSGQNADKHWGQASRTIDPFDVKADAILTLQVCGIDANKLQLITPGPSYFHPGRSGYLCLGPKNKLAAFGELHPRVLSQMDVDETIMGFEVYLSEVPLTKVKKKQLELSPFQPVERDFAFVVSKETLAGDVIQAAYKADNQLITGVQLFDVYEGQGIDPSKKSLALKVHIEPKTSTLTEEELNLLSTKIIESVAKSTGGELRT